MAAEAHQKFTVCRLGLIGGVINAEALAAGSYSMTLTIL